MDCSPPGSSVLGIFQARILEWAAISFSRGSSWPRDQTQVSCIAGRFFTIHVSHQGSPIWTIVLAREVTCFLFHHPYRVSNRFMRDNRRCSAFVEYKIVTYFLVPRLTLALFCDFNSHWFRWCSLYCLLQSLPRCGDQVFCSLTLRALLLVPCTPIPY